MSAPGKSFARRGTLRLTLLALAVLAVAPGQAAAFTDGTAYTLDIKVPPSSFQAGTQLDIPVYLVENRPPANGGSQLAEYNLGRVDSSFGSAQSKFLQFTPAPGLFAPTIVAQENPWIQQNGAETLVQFRFESPGTPGLAVTPDNSGIVGRTEVLIGTVRTEVGPAIPQQSGLPIIFEMVVKPSGGSSGVDGKTAGGAEPGLGDIPTRHIQVLAEPPKKADDDASNAAACGKARRKSKQAKQQASAAQRAAAKAGQRVDNAGPGKKAKAQRQAKQARKRAKQAKGKLRRAQDAAKRACA
jgi:hypothetical protein